MNKEVVHVRIAPSPTGIMHIGTVRTALANYLFKNTMSPGSKFYLRIEDTDKERNTDEYIDVIYENLKWLGIEYDDEPVIQSHNLKRHSEVANEILESGNAYYCFCSQDELEAYRLKCKETNIPQKYSGKCRCLTCDEIKDKINCGLKPTIRVKVPDSTTLKFPYIEVNDMIKGKVKVHYNELDDFIILRSDGSPTYMLSVVVDDHDMNITHVIRGDDHFTNTFRQICLYNACNWKIPKFGHLPLIFGDDGKKLSKRRQAVGINDFRKLGYTSEALKLYIGTMGYSSLNLKTITFNELFKTFNIKKISKSAVQFDMNFLNIINQQIIKSDKKYLFESLPFINKIFTGVVNTYVLLKAYQDIASRSKTLVEFAEISLMYLTHIKIDLNSRVDKLMIQNFVQNFENFNDEFELDKIKSFSIKFISDNNYSNDSVYTMLRLCLTGLENSPNVFNIMYALGYSECLNRLCYYV